jgi:GT2 family glycosyltransferase
MRLVVVIPTVGRRDVLERTVAHLARQSRLPDAVVVSTTEPAFVPGGWVVEANEIAETGLPFPLICTFGPKGLSAQRNRALDVLLGVDAERRAALVGIAPLASHDIITYFDDDFLPAANYLEGVCRSFAAHPDWSVLTGHVAHDGATCGGFEFDEGLALLGGIIPTDLENGQVLDTLGAYGCNMSVRVGAVGALRFDERLPLYGWQEDIDFSRQLARAGRVVRLTSLVGVHLGARSGRVSGVRFGYSQVANPLYLIGKGTMPMGFGANLVLRNVAANIVKSAWPESYVDRRGRLYGNLVAVSHALTGRLTPEQVLKL